MSCGCSIKISTWNSMQKWTRSLCRLGSTGILMLVHRVMAAPLAGWPRAFETCPAKTRGGGELVLGSGHCSPISRGAGYPGSGFTHKRRLSASAGQWWLELCSSFILIRSFLILSVSYFSYSTCRSVWQLHCFNVDLFIFYNWVTGSKICSPDMASINVSTYGGSCVIVKRCFSLISTFM